MAVNFGVEVVGIDLSINMISLALERAIGLKCSVEFEVADCTQKEYPENLFDVIYSRDTILHIQDKPALFRSFYKWLQPGGKVLISDCCQSSGTPSLEFAKCLGMLVLRVLWQQIKPISSYMFYHENWMLLTKKMINSSPTS